MIPSIPEGKIIIDLFGGSGSFCALVQKRNPKQVIYNDLNPWLGRFMKAMKYSQPEEILKFIKQHSREDPEFLFYATQSWGRMLRPDADFQPEKDFLPWSAALTILQARMTRGGRIQKFSEGMGIPVIPQNYKRHMLAFQKKVKDVSIMQSDFRRVIHMFKDDPEAFFLVDPPFPNDPVFDPAYKIESRHRELFEKLSNIRGRYLAFSSSNRATMEAVKGIVPSLYWHRGGTYACHVVAANYDVESALGQKLKPINLEKYGYLET